ncbi:MAG: tyrosine-type recombinase/integrase [Nitrososphaerota archaeon]|nr:tyrosine-type recombinase/integrase [Nitrososphaerota archaeon]MDG6923131.1 tyrosine-type recombinase/integrase [Nitrososphaerota archaeon]
MEQKLVSLAEFGKDDKEQIINDFHRFLKIDLQLSDSTARDLKNDLRHYLFDYLKEEPTVESVRDFLGKWVGQPEKYMHYLRTLKRFYRDFMGRPELVASFKFPTRGFTPPFIPTRNELQKWYSFIDSVKDHSLYNGDPLRLRAFFLVLASSGLRVGEVRTLRLCDVDLQTGKVTPYHAHATATSKKSNFSYINSEALEMLKKYVQEREMKTGETRLFEGNNSNWAKQFQIVSKASGIKLTPKNLRSWFSSEAAELRITDSYVDFLQGRTQRSVLARHYTDYRPEKLYRIYQGANLKVLDESNPKSQAPSELGIVSASNERNMTFEMIRAIKLAMKETEEERRQVGMQGEYDSAEGEDKYSHWK